MDFGDRSIYAMTHGLEVDCRLRPAPTGRAVMTVVRSGAGGGASGTMWAVQLLRDAGAAEGWRVTLKVAAVAADASSGASSAGLTEWRTKDAPVLPGVWSHLHVSWDGREPSILVDGVERWERPPIPAGATAPPDRGPMRLAQDSSGTATLMLSEPSASFVGLVDTLTVAGVFRSDEDVRRLPAGVVPLRTALPLRVVFANGRLDPEVHRDSVEVRLQAAGDSEDMWRWVRFGLYGGVEVGQGIQQPVERVP
jgi:hypothetical protein